jgi:rhodanese-related sulfurtransferase
MEERKDYSLFTMNHFYGVVVFSLVLLIGLVAYNANAPHYVSSPDESLNHITKNAQSISAVQLAEIINTKDSVYQIVDVRDPKDFANKHVEGAINIPIGRLFEKGFLSTLNQDKKITILIGSGAAESAIAYMMLHDEGYANLREVSFGVDFVISNIVENFAPLSGKYQEDRAMYDYAKVVSQTGGAAVGSSSSQSSSATPTAAPKKKKAASEGGGC